MASSSLSENGLLSPEWLIHRYNERDDVMHLVQAPRSLRRSTPFLVDEHLPGATTPVIAPRAEVLARAPKPAPLHFIFHSAFCCSTLLASAFDIDGLFTSYKEPQLLNDMVGWRHRRGDPGAIQQVLNQSLALLARPFSPGETVVIKPSNVTSGLAEAMMAMRPQAHAILMYAPLRVFLNSIARKRMDGRLWVRELLSRQLVDGLVNLGFEQRDYLLHTDLQAAAVGWLAQLDLFERMASKWPDRVRTLESETLLANPAAAMHAAAAHFGAPLTESQVEAIVAETFSKNSKDGAAFAKGQRAADRDSADTLHAEELERVWIWAEAVRETAGLPAKPSLPLLTQ